ncbi:hypothetical protein HII31_01940 [Pseudocercospora fuligena]|uniref:Mid2 domain-containing protein n=1 Tax=Pseudocercospora fuligena TaxID=685502 RepID=A0A8H6VLW0_9PEZI|nr:hypothetical protein HII31_01940 [Pseudocercospora fuligena]
MSVSKIIYYAVDFTFLYQGRQLTTRSVATSTTWLSAGSDQIKIHCTYTNLFATPTIITIDTSFAFAENAVETSLSPNLQNVIIDGASTYTSWGASAIATTAETGGNVASNVSSSSDPATSNANGTAPVSHAHQSSIANGEIVGIGIGCAIIGALLASLIACLLLRRRSRRQGYSVATRSTSSGSAGESDKIPAIPLSRTIATGLSSALPQPEEDRTIIANVSKLDTVIKNHAHSFYAQATTFQPSEDAISLVEKLLYNCTAINARDLNTMLSKLDSRIGAVRFLLSWSVLSNVGYKSQVDYTLLPPALAECLSAMNLEDGTSPGE